MGAVVPGVGGDNSNNSWGTFFEGALLEGWPSDTAELRVMRNVRSAGYGQQPLPEAQESKSLRI